jgi:hypothetical protein
MGKRKGMTMATEQSARSIGPPDQLSSGVDVRGHIVPIVRRWLQSGVSSENLRSSVRIQEINELAGGLKAPAVGAVNVSVQVIVKQGSSELLQHQQLMNEVNKRFVSTRNSSTNSQIFPEVMRVDRMDGFSADRDHLMIQQALVKFETVQSLLYSGTQGLARAEKALLLGLPAMEFIHRISESQRGPLKDLPRTPDPFTQRITERLNRLSAQIRWLETAFDKGIRVDGEMLPPLSETLEHLANWQAKRTKELKLSLVHGDPHIANLMTRQRGKGESIRWIDPNPTVGFSDPAYDWGKVLHFLEPVGWAKESADAFQVRVTGGSSSPQVTTSLKSVTSAIEDARKRMESLVRTAALTAMRRNPDKEAVLELAIASAHAGYAALDIGSGLNSSEKRVAEKRREFATALKLRALARWYRLSSEGG